MNSDYETTEAAGQLETHALERLNSPHSGLQMSRIASVTARYEVMPIGNTRRLVHKADGNAVCEEVTAMFQGIICKQDLPPITERLGKNSSQARFLRQSVTITGLLSPTFNRVVHNVAEIHAVLGRAVGMERMEECGMISSYKGMPAVELSNRYFTPRSQAEGVEVPFSADIDPHGYLTQAAGAGFYHSEENQVAYFERGGTNDDDYRYSPANPVIFCVGDIVEVQASFVAVPLKEGRSKSLMVLRGLTLIDGTFTQRARVKRLTMQSNVNAQAPRQVVKRKIGYYEEEVSVARAKMGRMDIDSDMSEKGAGDLNVTDKGAGDLQVGNKSINDVDR